MVSIGRLHDDSRPGDAHLLQGVLVQDEAANLQRPEHVAAVCAASEDVHVAMRRKLSQIEEGHHVVVVHQSEVVAAGRHLVHGEVERVAGHVWVRVQVPGPSHVAIAEIHVSKHIEVRFVILQKRNKDINKKNVNIAVIIETDTFQSPSGMAPWRIESPE